MRLADELAACPYGVDIVHLPLVAIVQYCLAGRGLPAAGAWAVVCVLVVVVSFLLAAGLRRLPGVRRCCEPDGGGRIPGGGQWRTFTLLTAATPTAARAIWMSHSIQSTPLVSATSRPAAMPDPMNAAMMPIAIVQRMPMR